MLKIGLTGGIGSGKSTVAAIFSQLGVPVFYSDIEAKKLVATDASLLAQIRMAFGDEVFDAYSHLDAKKMAQKVFSNNELLLKLNSIIHPAVRKQFANWLTMHQTVPYILNESALVFEHDLQRDLDAVIVVLAPENMRVKRVSKRDNVQEIDVLQRMKNQVSDSERKQKGTYFILNDELHALIPQVLKINAQLRGKSAQ